MFRNRQEPGERVVASRKDPGSSQDVLTNLSAKFGAIWRGATDAHCRSHRRGRIRAGRASGEGPSIHWRKVRRLVD